MDGNVQIAQAEKDMADAEKLLADVDKKETETATAKAAEAQAEAAPVEPDATEAQPTDQGTETTPAASIEKPEVVADDTAAVVQKKAELEAEIAALEKRKRDINGEIGGEISRRSKLVVDELTKTVTALQQEIAALKSARPAAADPGTEPGDDVLLAGIPEEDRKAYAEVIALQKKIALNAAKATGGRSNATAELAELRQRMDAQASIHEASQREQFNQLVESKAKGFAEVNGGNGRDVDPAWDAHLDTLKPGTRVTWRQSIQGVAENPVDESAEAYNAFLKATGRAVEPPAVKTPKSTAGQVQPRRSGTAPAITESQPTDPKAAYSELLKALETGKISSQEFEKKSRALDQQMGMAPTG